MRWRSLAARCTGNATVFETVIMDVPFEVGDMPNCRLPRSPLLFCIFARIPSQARRMNVERSLVRVL